MLGVVFYSLLTFLVSEVQSIVLLRRNLSDFPLARCNDGSPAAYFYQQDIRKAGNKFLIYLPDGGNCGSVDQCNARCTETRQLCSGPESPVMKIPSTGVWENKGSPFSDHFKVSIHYCSSDSFSGTRGGSNSTGGLIFQGRHILSAALQDMTQRFKLSSASQIVLAGAGSGARAVGLNCDHVRNTVQKENPSVDFRCLVDGGDFDPWWVRKDEIKCHTEMHIRFEDEKILWGRQDDESCVDKFQNILNSTELAHRCGLFSLYWNTISAPLFVISPQYNPEKLQDRLLCSLTDREELAMYELAWRTGIVSLSQSIMASSFSNVSLFVPGCSSVSSYIETKLDRILVPLVRGQKKVPLSQMLTAWLHGKYLRAVDPVGQENINCSSSSAPLLSENGKTNLPYSKKSNYPVSTIDNHLLPPSHQLFPQGYRPSCSLNPWYSTCGADRRRQSYQAAEANRKKRLWSKLLVLAQLRKLYKHYKNEYAREYHGVGVLNTPGVHRGSGVLTTKVHRGQVGVRRPVVALRPTARRRPVVALRPTIRRPVLPFDVGVRRPALPTVPDIPTVVTKLVPDYQYVDYDFYSDYSPDYYSYDYGLVVSTNECGGKCGNVPERGIVSGLLPEGGGLSNLDGVLDDHCGPECKELLGRFVKSVNFNKNNGNPSGRKKRVKNKKRIEKDDNNFIDFLSEVDFDYENFDSEVETLKEKTIKLKEKSVNRRK